MTKVDKQVTIWLQITKFTQQIPRELAPADKHMPIWPTFEDQIHEIAAKKMAFKEPKPVTKT